MSDYQDKPGDGTLFVNTNKEKPTQPDRTGFVLAHRDIKAGERVRLAGWLATRQDGSKVTDRQGNPILNIKMSDERSMSDVYGGGESEQEPDELDGIPF